MRMTDLRPKNIGIGRFILLAGAYLLITLAVFSILFRDYQFELNVGIDRTLLLVLMAFIAYKLQSALSSAYGGGRVVDWLVSIPMLVVTGAAFLLWLNIPVVASTIVSLASAVWLELTFTPDEFKKTTMFIFLAIALWDVVVRDWFGFGRQSRGNYGGTASGRADRLEKQEKHQPFDIPSESGNDFFEGDAPIGLRVPPIAKLRLPSGKTLEIPVSPRLEDRIIWNANRPKTSGTKEGEGGADAGT